MSECENNCDLYIMDADGGSLRPLTDNLVFDVFPAWSPDSRRVAYMSNRDRYFEIYVMEVVDGRTGLDCPGLPEGCPLHRLTVNPAFDGFPSWSPDGRQIVFSSDRAGNFDLYLAPSDCYRLPDGCEVSLRRLTDTEADDLVPSWSPDGRQIAFISGRNLYLIAAAGGIPQRLATGITRDQWVAWRP
jgi:TolB protein